MCPIMFSPSPTAGSRIELCFLPRKIRISFPEFHINGTIPYVLFYQYNASESHPCRCVHHWFVGELSVRQGTISVAESDVMTLTPKPPILGIVAKKTLQGAFMCEEAGTEQSKGV